VRLLKIILKQQAAKQQTPFHEVRDLALKFSRVRVLGGQTKVLVILFLILSLETGDHYCINPL
jgi:hypothetical protein